MAYNIFKPNQFINEFQKRQELINIEKPIISQYYTESRAKLKPSIIENVNVNNYNKENLTDESAIRTSLINELSPILKNQTVNFVEGLVKSNDLYAFYKFSKPFLNEVKDIRNLDSNFLYELWTRYKSKMLIESEKTINIPSVLTAEEYEKKLQNPSFKKTQKINKLLNTLEIPEYDENIKRLDKKNKTENIENLLYHAPYGYREHYNPHKREKTYLTNRKPLQHLSKKSQLYYDTKKQQDLNKYYNKFLETYSKTIPSTQSSKASTAYSTPTTSRSSLHGGSIPGQTYYARR